MLGVFAFPVLLASIRSTTRKELFTMVRVLVMVSMLVYWLATMDYSEIAKELEKQEKLLAEKSAAGTGGRAFTQSPLSPQEL